LRATSNQFSNVRASAATAGNRPKGSFDLATRDSILKGGQSGEPAVVPGYANDSPMVRYVAGKVEDLDMPPLNRRGKYPALSAEELVRVRTWIDAGAPWPASITLRTTATTP
jgi:hypothetical protein